MTSGPVGSDERLPPPGGLRLGARAGERARRRVDPFLLLALALALLVRAGLLLRYPLLSADGDEPLHYVLGVLTSHFGTGVIGRWAPGYEVFLGAVFRVAGPSVTAAKGAQVVLGTATVGLVYGIARGAGERRAARIAAVMAALHPTLVAYTHYLYSETLFLALLAGALYALYRSPGEPTRGELLAAGILFGLASLVRAVFVYFLPLWLGVALLRGRRREAFWAALVLGMTLLCVLPWSARNVVHHGGFLLVDPTLGRTAYIAYNPTRFNRDLGYLGGAKRLPERKRCRPTRAAGAEPLPPVASLRELFPGEASALVGGARRLDRLLARARREALTDFAALQRCELENALDYALRRPGAVAKRVAQRAYAFWGPNSFLLRYIHEGVYPGGPLGRGQYGIWKGVVIAAHVLVFGAALLAYTRRPLPRLFPFVALLASYYTVVHMFAVAYSRYRLPLLPAAIALAAVWLASPRAPRLRGREAVLLSLLAAFLALCAHYAWTVLP